jgi:hypothetical protein
VRLKLVCGRELSLLHSVLLSRSEEDEGSDSDGDAFSDGEAPLAALARSYDKLQRAYNRRSGRQRQDSASNSDSGTIGGGSDADNETGTTDHDMSDNDDEGIELLVEFTFIQTIVFSI